MIKNTTIKFISLLQFYLSLLALTWVLKSSSSLTSCIINSSMRERERKIHDGVRGKRHKTQWGWIIYTSFKKDQMRGCTVWHMYFLSTPGGESTLLLPSFWMASCCWSYYTTTPPSKLETGQLSILLYTATDLTLE